ncbi:trigger factor [Thermobifida fusca YX]|uniref:Trigger factor n=1 Tax=Thermobifida fusca (strain YX) TaxID=269800 RepID=TIG_THEFY|nr:RecName: Full=Trigger factor; Short=TF; AltName: Full=PPIase [Thermobifida fusca YX]AAZ56228.1 trigger factor [Thermobifida fusca YX]
MKTAVEELSPTRVKLTIEVPFEELDHAFDVTYKSLAKQVRIKGFRPGKAPAKLIDRYVGRGAVLTQAVNHAVPELYSEAVSKEEVPVLGPPEVEITRLEDGKELAFTAEVDVRPKFEVTDYEGIEVTVDDAEVTEEQVNERLEALRQRFATLIGVDRPAEQGDHVSIDLSASVDGKKLEDAQASGVSYEIGAGTLLQGLDEAIIGLSAGESATFTTTLVGGEHKGREADVTVTVHSVKLKELPELDDEFARLASEFDTIEELRASEAERLGELLRAQQLRQARDRVLEKLVDSIDIPLPESVIKQEADRRRELLDRQLSQSGLSKEAYLEAQEKTEEEFEAELTENATRAVKTGFVLDQLASQENLTASNEELTQYVVEQAQSMGISPDQLFQSLMQANQLQLVYVEVLRAKALDLVVSKAKITDESGNTIEPPTPVHTETITVASGDEETEESAAEQGETEK